MNNLDSNTRKEAGLYSRINDCISCRCVLNVMVFIGFMMNYVLRVNLNFAIIEMVLPSNASVVNRTEAYQAANESSTEYVPTRHLSDLSRPMRFSWSEAQQGLLIGSFFWGYVCTELPGGRLSEIIGTRKVFGYAMLAASVLTLLTPFFAKISFVALVLLRILLGLLMGPTWPSILPLAAKWIPPNERGKFMSNMMGSTLGAGLTFPLCAFILTTLTWEYVFYVTGLLGIAWSAAWFLLVFDEPASHPRISAEERRYIETQLGYACLVKEVKQNEIQMEDRTKVQYPKRVVDAQSSDDETSSLKERNAVLRERFFSTNEAEKDSSNSHPNDKFSTRNSSSSSDGTINKNEFRSLVMENSDKKSSQALQAAESDAKLPPTRMSSHENVPWLKIATSVPVWAFVVTHTASVFGYNTITNQLPTYSKFILKLETKKNGIQSSLPYFGKYIMAMTAGVIADIMMNKTKLTKNFIKKLFTGVGVMLPGFFMILQIYFGYDQVYAIAIFTAALLMNGMVTGGYLSNTLDLAPNYSGTIFGLANMFSSAGGAVSAQVVGYLTNKNQTFQQWQKVFGITAVVYIVGSFSFLIFGSTDLQPWNSESPKQKDKKRPLETESGTDDT